MLPLTDAPPSSLKIALEEGLAEYNAQQSTTILSRPPLPGRTPTWQWHRQPSTAHDGTGSTPSRLSGRNVGHGQFPASDFCGRHDWEEFDRISSAPA
jgi:hypothetical protein